MADGVDRGSEVSKKSENGPEGLVSPDSAAARRARSDEFWKKKRFVLQSDSPPADIETAEALDRCRKGDVDGLRVLYELHRQRVYRTCVRILGDPSEAEDVTQEIFLRVFDKAARFGGRASITTWLYRLTVNYCLNSVRGRRNRESRLRPLDPVNEAISMDRPDRDFQRREAADLVERLLARLTEQHRTIVVLRDIEGLSYREISEVLSLPNGTVMSRLSRARQAMKATLRETQIETCEKPAVAPTIREAAS